MLAQSSQSIPVYAQRIAQLTTKRRRTNPTFGTRPFSGGLSGCGCGPVGGCDCEGLGGYAVPYQSQYGYGLAGLGQSASLDQIISNAFSWLSGTVQGALPPSASVPPQYGSTGALSTMVQQWLPWVIGGYIVYRLVK